MDIKRNANYIENYNNIIPYHTTPGVIRKFKLVLRYPAEDNSQPVFAFVF